MGRDHEPGRRSAADIYRQPEIRGHAGADGSSANAKLPQLDEFAFRQWVADNRVPFSADSKAPQDYDMRGYWRGLMQDNPRATSWLLIANVSAVCTTRHYWKTPYHRSFSNESQYATQDAPQWMNDSQLAAPSGRILFDEKR